MKPTYVYAATCVKVIDGDTLDLLVDLGFRAFEKVRVRLRGYNAPELSTAEGRAKQTYARDVLMPPIGEPSPAHDAVLQGPALLRALGLRRVDARRHAAGRRAGAGEGAMNRWICSPFGPHTWDRWVPWTSWAQKRRCRRCGYTQRKWL
jgi:hypothetical protein